MSLVFLGLVFFCCNVQSLTLDILVLLDANSCHESLGCEMCGDWTARASYFSFYFTGTDL